LGMTGTDTVAWRAAVEQQRPDRDALRASLGLRGAVLLFVGRLVPLKGIPEMLRACEQLTRIDDLPPWSVLFVGSGPADSDIDAWRARHPDVPVASTGFVQPDRLPEYYAAADVFVMPSLEDVWGLVCLEALVAGLPQVTSTLVGAAPDLITHPDIGDTVDPRDTDTFARHLAQRIRQAPHTVPDPHRTNATQRWSATAAADRSLTSIHTTLHTPTLKPVASHGRAMSPPNT
jgi:glycosyltransferase involved in cell wall biosynthesis